MREPRITHESGATEMSISAGGKQVRATVITEGQTARAYTRVENTSEPRQNGITTFLYSLVRIFFQKQANELNKPVDYVLTTEDLKITQWAQDETKGAGVFDWDDVETSEETEDGSFVAKRRINPKR